MLRGQEERRAPESPGETRRCLPYKRARGKMPRNPRSAYFRYSLTWGLLSGGCAGLPPLLGKKAGGSPAVLAVEQWSLEP